MNATDSVRDKLCSAKVRGEGPLRVCLPGHRGEALAAALGLWLFLAAAVVPAQAHKFRVDDPNEARAALAGGGKVVADYGSFAIVESADDVPLPVNSRIQRADALDYIRLQSGALFTRSAARMPRATSEAGFSGRRLHLVQFVGPIKPEWRRAMESTGVRVVAYLPEDAYLVYGDSGALDHMQAWASGESCVQWQGAYLPDYKAHPSVRSAMRAGSLQGPGAGTFAIQLVADPEANGVTLQLISQSKLAPVRREYSVLNYHNIIVSLPAEALGGIAARPDVVSIQPYREPRKKDERQDQIAAGNLTGNTPSGPGYLDWLAAKGFSQAQFTASGFVVDVSDSGIDNGTLAPGHFGLFPEADLAQSSRVAYSRLVGTANPGSTLQGCDGHGTLNAHIIGGYDRLPGFPHADAGGFSYGLGICPFVRVGASVVFDPDSFTDPNPATLQTQAFNDGARISNNSWGATNDASYDQDAQTYDALVRDAGGGSGQRQMVIVFVAGNEGPAASTIDSPGTAKNVITVGASENVRSLSIPNGGNDGAGNDACGDPDTSASSANDVIDFSSMGPCADGRSKPDLVAPGTHVTGGVPQAGSATTNGLGSALDCFNASSVCALPGSGVTQDTNNFFPLGQQWFTVSSGTSHAGPAVAGACALVRQYFINLRLTPPSPAMTKAYLMNSARYLTGSFANDTLWSQSQGMGGLDLGAAFDGVPRILRDQLASDKFVASGQRRVFSGAISDPTRPFRVTLAWTDAAGNPAAAKALVNDLDLVVSAGGSTYLGNVFSGANSVTGGQADSLNNVESVFLPAGTATGFTVTVTAANIAADALMNGVAPVQQDFALVINNAILTNTPPYVATADSYAGLFTVAGTPEVESSGSVSLRTTTRGTFSGSLRTGLKQYGFSGRFDDLGASSITLQRPQASPLLLNLQVDTTENARITGSVSTTAWQANVLAIREVYNAKDNPASFAAKYTLIVPGNGNPTNSASPQGDGYCAVAVAGSGKIKTAGALADGTRISSSAICADDGQWPLYVPLYHGGGCLVGWLDFFQSAQSDLGGIVTWIREPDAKSTSYAGGFSVQTNAIGSLYQPPVSAWDTVLNLTTGSVVLSGGGLAETLSNPFTFGQHNKVEFGTNGFAMTFLVPQGLFKGSAADPASRKRISFSGAILQKQNKGSGFFLGPIGGGRVSIGP